MSRFAVIGLGRFGRTLAEALSRQGEEVIAIDFDQTLIDDIQDQVKLAMKLDATDEESLLEAGMASVDTAVIAFGDDFEAIQISLIALKALGVAEVIARAKTPSQEKILRKLGADRVINTEQRAAEAMASRLSFPSVLDSLGPDDDVDLVHVSVPKTLEGQTVRSASLRDRFNINIVAIAEPGSNDNADGIRYRIPNPDEVLNADTSIVLFGVRSGLKELLGS